MSSVIAIVLIGVAVPAVPSCLYLLLATLLSAAPPIPAGAQRRMRFDVIVPAHNEANVIERTIASLRRLRWPAGAYRVLVVADNCSDATAEIARRAGATVLERQDGERRGKGYALDHAFRFSIADRWAAAVVVIDADAEVSANLLEAFAARIELGENAVQAHYGVLNPLASWRTRLITIAKAAFHIVRSRAREHLGLSCGIRGNGWCVTHALLEKVPYQAFSLTEDLEYGITLGLAGVRVAYADEAHSDAEMVSNEQVAGRQRQRWESGRFQLIRTMTLPLLRAAFQRRSLVCLDLALDLMLLPLSYVALNIILLALGVAAAAAWSRAPGHGFIWLAPACAACVLLYVLRGWQLSGIGARGLIDLARAPGFLVWKLLVTLRRRSTEWVRTEREHP